jgi:hypothetical protein
MKVTIESRHKCLTIVGEEESRCGCGVGVIYGGIPHGGACPSVGGVHGSDQYPWPEGEGGVLELWPRWLPGGGGDQYPPGGGGAHVEGYSAAGDPPHDITGVGPV